MHPSVEMPHFPVHMADTGGHSVTALSIVRLYYMYRNFFVVEEDPTYSLAYIISAVESNCAIVAATIPALWPLARRWFPSMDDKLGINRPHQADIEVQLFGDVDPTTAASARQRLRSPGPVPTRCAGGATTSRAPTWPARGGTAAP